MAANGVGVPTQVVLSGTGVTAINAGVTYQVTLSLTGTTTVAVTGAVKDAAGSTPTYTGSYNWVSRNAAPSGQAGDVATVSGATGNPITVTAVSKGMAIIECSVPAFDTDGANDINTGKVYARLQVQVDA